MRRELYQYPVTVAGDSDRIRRKLLSARPTLGGFIFGEQSMDKDRIEGSEKGIIGKIKEVGGKVLGDAKLQSDRKTDQAAGKVQNAVGGIKDTLKGK
jgi:uncharacterized protein YjbJ (UPF0337 family)